MTIVARFECATLAMLAGAAHIRPNSVPSVECYRLSTIFFLMKEALVGCAVFAAYPLWRKLWRRWHPLS